MAKQVPFIGRDNELVQIDKLIGEWGARKALFIHGQGGIGKTRLLEEVFNRYSSKEESPLLMAEVIDFDDRGLHLPENVERRIARRVDEKGFEPFLRSLLDKGKMTAAGVSLEILEHQEERVRQTLLSNFNQVSADQRIVLRLDTTDKMEKAVWHNLQSFIATAKNTLFLLAGRNSKDLWAEVQDQLGEDAQLIELAPLELKFGQQYLAEKLRQLNTNLDEDLTSKLLFMAGGRPIIIDLAVEWLSRDLPRDWMTKYSLDDLKSLSEEEMKAQIKDFEIQLVHRITQIRTPMDQLLLLMSRVYPLTVAMISTFQEIPVSEANKLFEEARIYSFVKTLPDGRISLHDVMRDMVRQYVWPEVDPDGDRQRRDSQLAVTYLDQEIQSLLEKIEGLITEQEKAHQELNAQAELTAFTDRETSERELWAAREQLLFHTLYINLEQGLNTFTDIFDEATRTYRFSLREVLLDQIQRYTAMFSPQQSYELESRRVKHWLDRGEYRQASVLVTKILERENLSAEQNIDMLIQRGNIEIRLGNLRQGISDFEAAVKFSEGNGLDDWRARALNARGWAYRNQGNLDSALIDYLDAYHLSLQQDDPKRTAWILNNMGYVNALKGNQIAALANCQEALGLWEKVGFGRGLGATYSNLGEIHRRFDQLSESMVHYNKALNIFIRENDVEWISTVRCGRASILRFQKELEQAQDELNKASENAAGNLKPRILYEQAKIYWAKNELEKAREHLEACENLSLEIGDTILDFRSFVDFLDLAWGFGEWSRWKEFSKKYNVYYAKREGEEATRLRGSYYRKLGDLAICHNDYEEGLTAYKQGFLLISTHEVHKPYTIGEQIKKTDERLHKNATGKKLLRKLGMDLAQFWRGKIELVTNHPEALTIFYRWQQEQE